MGCYILNLLCVTNCSAVVIIAASPSRRFESAPDNVRRDYGDPYDPKPTIASNALRVLHRFTFVAGTVPRPLLESSSVSAEPRLISLGFRIAVYSSCEKPRLGADRSVRLFLAATLHGELLAEVLKSSGSWCRVSVSLTTEGDLQRLLLCARPTATELQQSCCWHASQCPDHSFKSGAPCNDATSKRQEV